MAEPATLPAFTFEGINFWVKDVGNDRPGIESEYSQENAGLTLTYRVDWNLRKEARRALVGNTVYQPGAPQYGFLSRQLPHCYTEEEDWLWCKRATIKPEVARPASDAGVPGALYAEIVARYEPMPYELIDDGSAFGAEGFPDESQLIRYVSYPPPKSKDRVLTARAGTWKFVDRAVAIPVGVGITVNEIEEQIIWHQVPRANIPWLAISECFAKANDDVFDGRLAGKMVLSAYSFRELPRLGDGTLAVDVIYTFTHKPRGANFFPDPDRGNLYVAVVAFDGSGRVPHEPADFRGLFRPTPGA